MTKNKIAIVSFRLNAPPRNNLEMYRDKRKIEIKDIFSEAQEHNVTHVLFPGWTFVYDRCEYGKKIFEEDIKWLKNISLKCCVIAEFTIPALKSGRIVPPEGLGVISLDKGKEKGIRIQQKIARSEYGRGEPSPNYQLLANEVYSDTRSVRLGGIEFLILICGEINLLGNIQSKANRVILPHSASGRNLETLLARSHKIVFNPGHTEMGNQAKLQKRWCWLSKPRVAGETRHTIHLSNVLDENRGGRAIFVFKNGLDSNSKCNFYRLGKWISCGNIVVFPTDQSERCTDERLHATYPRTTIPDSCLFESWFHAKRDRHRNRLPSFHHQS